MDDMMVRIPIWFLYLLQLLFPINYAIKLFLICGALAICKRCLPKSGCFEVGVVLKSWCIAVVTEIAALAAIFIAEKNLPLEYCDEHYRMIDAIAVAFSLVLSFLLNFLFAFSKTNTSRGQKALLAAILTILCAPFLLLISTEMPA
ncbi:MAG: hypothetical protein IKD11_05385 [Oscillospiraceae bacterium]|nr:hypothetical protein [Oscillospiraceae bacterium]